MLAKWVMSANFRGSKKYVESRKPSCGCWPEGYLARGGNTRETVGEYEVEDVICSSGVMDMLRPSPHVDFTKFKKCKGEVLGDQQDLGPLKSSAILFASQWMDAAYSNALMSWGSWKFLMMEVGKLIQGALES